MIFLTNFQSSLVKQLNLTFLSGSASYKHRKLVISHFLRVKRSCVDVIEEEERKSEVRASCCRTSSSCSRLDPIGEATWKRPGGGNLGGGPFITRCGEKKKTAKVTSAGEGRPDVVGERT